jgi:hypothetical protein
MVLLPNKKLHIIKATVKGQGNRYTKGALPLKSGRMVHWGGAIHPAKVTGTDTFLVFSEIHASPMVGPPFGIRKVHTTMCLPAVPPTI